MSVKSRKCNYCGNKLPEGWITGETYQPTCGGPAVQAFCDGFCQSLYNQRQFRPRAGVNLRFNATSNKAPSDEPGNRSPASDVEAMRERLD